MKRIMVLTGALLLAAAAMAQDAGVVLRESALKQEPYSDAATVATLSAQTAVNVVERKGAWLKVTAGEHGGWLRLLAVRSGGVSGKTGDSGLSQALNVARTGASGSATATGVRGLDKEQIANASPDFAQLAKLDGYAAQGGDARALAAGPPALSEHTLDYLSASGK